MEKKNWIKTFTKEKMEDSREVFRFTILTGAGNIRRSSDDDYILSGNEKPVESRVIQYRFAKILKNGK